jgi:hypothetical protein
VQVTRGPASGPTKRWRGLVAACVGVALAAPPGRARARETDEGAVEHTIVVGAGGAGEVELGDGSVHAGGSVMVEWDAVEDWLELEVGASVLSAGGGFELPVDLLVKKPFRLAPRAELMIGLGPELVTVSDRTARATYLGGELALDFMFWPWGRRVGLWVEPEYDLVFRDGTASGLGSTGGVLLGW